VSVLEENKAEKKIHLRVITPTQTKVDQTVDMVVMRATSGDLGVLPDHEPYLCALSDGVLRLLNGRRERRLAVFGGIAEIGGDAVTILTEEAHWPGDIDQDRAKETREHLERQIQEKTDNLEILRDQILLRRALVKLDVSSFRLDSELEDEEE